MAVIVTIGRNVGDKPMDTSDWLDFQDAIEHALYAVYAPEVHFKGEGLGNSGPWGEEEAWTIVAADCTNEFHWALLQVALAAVTILYKQEAVAVTRGETLFV